MPERDLEQVVSRLVAGKPVAGVLLLGQDAYLREECRRSLVEAVVPEGARPWAVWRFSLAETELERILAQAQMLPMLSQHQVVFAEDAEAMEKLDDDARDAAVERLSAYLDHPAPFTLLVFEAVQLDQRMKLYKLFNDKLLVVSVSMSEEARTRGQAAAAFAARMAAEFGVELDSEAALELADVLNGELARIRTEVEKLACYVGTGKRITTAEIELLVVTEKKYSVWQLADMLAGRQRNLALEFLNGVLREGEEPVGIVGALAWMYRKLIQAQELPPHASVWDATRLLGIRKETAEVALRQARRIPQAQLLEGLGALYEADSQLKSGGPNPNAVLEFLVARLTA